jgi:hypothetical protein
LISFLEQFQFADLLVSLIFQLKQVSRASFACYRQELFSSQLAAR